MGEKGGGKGAGMKEPEAALVGIAVATGSLGVAVRPRGEQRRLDHDAAGSAEAVAWRRASGPQVIVAEATGGDEAPQVAE
jgi:hypothetical protein